MPRNEPAPTIDAAFLVATQYSLAVACDEVRKTIRLLRRRPTRAARAIARLLRAKDELTSSVEAIDDAVAGVTPYDPRRARAAAASR
jgi:hypothetical protein